MNLLNDFIACQERLIRMAKQELALIERTNPNAGYDLPKEFARQMRRLAKLEGRLASAQRLKTLKEQQAAEIVFGSGV